MDNEYSQYFKSYIYSLSKNVNLFFIDRPQFEFWSYEPNLFNETYPKFGQKKIIVTLSLLVIEISHKMNQYFKNTA